MGTCDTSGDRFPVGQTLVNCKVNSAGGRGTGTFSVHINPPPTETPDPPIIQPGEGSGLFRSGLGSAIRGVEANRPWTATAGP